MPPGMFKANKMHPHAPDEPLYRPLESASHLRLLRVRRSADRSLECELKAFSLEINDTPHYTPISYVWGNPNDTEAISVNGRKTTVLKPVVHVLGLFCDQAKLQDHRWIWVDSVCINQDDLAERAAQVALMKTIYGRSSLCVIWLGEATEHSKKGFALMRAISNVKDPHLHHSLGSQEDWDGFVEVAQRPWWRRAWTLQESILPSDVYHGTLYYCGTEYLTGEDVIRVAERQKRMRSQAIEIDETVTAPMFHRRRVFIWHGPNPQTSLLALLAYSSFLEATNPRDYIYSVLGCVNEVYKELIGPPKYDTSVAQLYTEVTIRWIAAWRNLDILSFAQIFCRPSHSTDADGILPSWVPDWRNRSKDPSFERGRLNAVPLLVSETGKCHIGGLTPTSTLPYPRGQPKYLASKKLEPRLCISSDYRELACSAIFIDEIDGLSAMLDPARGHTDEIVELLVQPTSPDNISLDYSATNEASSKQDADKGHSTDLSIASIRTDVAYSLTFGRKDIWLQYGVDWKRFFMPLVQLLSGTVEDGPSIDACSYFRSWIAANGSMMLCRRTLREVFSEEGLNTSEIKTGSDDLELSVNKMWLATHHTEWARRLCVTRRGHIGMVPEHAQKGDKIYVLLGCNVPMALRKLPSGSFELVGECYVQGFMVGEAVDDSSLPREDVTLV